MRNVPRQAHLHWLNYLEEQCSFFTIFVINLEDQLVESPPRKLVVPNIRGKCGGYVNKL
jgi:hypothetical protein